MNDIQPHQYIPEFGLSSAQLHRSHRDMQERVSGAMGWKGVYESIDDIADFYSYSSTAVINGVKLSSVANSRIHTKTISDQSSAIFIPTAGEQSTSIVNGKEINWGVKSVGIYAPPGERIGYGGNRSVLIMDIDHQRMQNTLNTMLGKEVSISCDLNQPLELALKHSQIDFVSGLKHLVKQIDIYSNNAKLLELSGLDDQLYRMAACWMFPHLVLADEADTNQHSQLLKLIKEYVYANLHRSITLTELETLSCVSRRTLQHLFMKQTQLSPLQWVREQRLLMARQRLQRIKSYETITEIALSLGFYSSAQFSTLYKQRFGVVPSMHLKKA